jgi:hypothetical protein
VERDHRDLEREADEQEAEGGEDERDENAEAVGRFRK